MPACKPEGRFEDLPDLIEIPEWGRFVGLGRDAAYDAVQRGEVPVLKIGRRLVVPKFALGRMLYEAKPLEPAGSEFRLRIG